MAGADPRRSSRARVTQPVSSTSSSLSGRAERNSRHFKAGSPPKSTTTGSLSSEPPEDTITAEDTFGSRRRTRGQPEDRERPAGRTETIEMANGDDDEIQEEDEAVRCICGFDEYPGPPPIDEDSKHGLRDTTDLDPIFATDLSDDAAGFFVQCDLCKVWQHGACVGIMTEESSPDEYFCEECRKDFHKTFTASNGQRYSHYLPLKRSSRAASRSASLNKDGPRSPPKEKEGRESRSGRASSSSQTSKRRSTMNSREAGYDEAEALRRAIEASKEDAPLEPGDGGSRRAKRVRSDSEEKQESAKRQRTSSRSLSPSPGKNADDSDDGAPTRNGGSRSRPRSSAAGRNQRTEKPSEREERERQRIEAANKRKGRAERRRADDSDPSEELPLAARAAANRTTAAATGTPKETSAAAATTTVPTTAVAESVQQTAPEVPPPSQPTTDTPSPSVIPAARVEKKRSHKKKGRNQYTRDRDDEDSPARSQSRDIQKDEHTGSGNGRGASDHAHGKSHAKAKGGMSSKVTLTDMKRKASALLDFISRTQVELAGETLPDTGSNTPKVNGSAPSATGSDKNLEVAGGNDVPAPVPGSGDGPRAERDFKELNCLEMMDSLTRRLVKWQQEYAA